MTFLIFIRDFYIINFNSAPYLQFCQPTDISVHIYVRMYVCWLKLGVHRYWRRRFKEHTLPTAEVISSVAGKRDIH